VSSEPADLAEVHAVLNELKTDINAHLLVAAAHREVGSEAPSMRGVHKGCGRVDRCDVRHPKYCLTILWTA